MKWAGDEPYYEAVTGRPETLLVQLHSWSGTKDEALASPDLYAVPNCVWVCPHFGGQNNHPQGAGHPAQLERIKRVIDKARLDYDSRRIILIGGSGGGYMCMMVAGAFPGLVHGITSWVGIHDLAAWWNESPNYRESLTACFGGGPVGREAEYLARSPKGVLPNARNLIAYINHGTSDAEVLPHHGADAAAQLTGLPGVTVHHNPFAGGHVIKYPEAIQQINSIARLT